MGTTLASSRRHVLRMLTGPGHRSTRLFSILALAAIVIAIALVARRHGSSPDPEVLFMRAVDDMHAGRWKEARAGLDRLERLRPPTPKEWALRAELAEAEGDSAGALDALHHVPDGDPLGSEALYMAGLIERKSNRLRPAEAAYRRAIELNPKQIKAHKELIYILGMQFRRREVDAEFKALSRLTPLTHHDLFVWCLTHFVVWGPDSAENLASFIQADPGDRYSRLALATLWISQPGREADVERILEPLPPDDSEALALRVELTLNHGRTDEAIAMLAGTNVKTPHLARLRGRVALMRGDFGAASRYFRDALSDEPYDRVSITELGKALLLQGDREAAEKYVARARQLDEVYRLVNRISKTDEPNQEVALNQLGKACEDAGLVDEAKGWYQLSIGLNPLDAEAQRGLHRLRAAEGPSIPSRDAGR